MITYRVIGFGTNEHGFFNQKAFTSSIGYAVGFMTGHKQDPETTGAVLIKVEHESWSAEVCGALACIAPSFQRVRVQTPTLRQLWCCQILRRVHPDPPPLVPQAPAVR